MSVLPDTEVGAYRTLERIGAGGMGEVWLAEHAMLGRRAAIKVLRSEFSSRPEIVARFFNEARAATAIGDPGIVQIFDYGHHVDGSAYIVMELLDGEPLDKRLAHSQRLAVLDALRIMRQVASTLGAAHARGIVHRDLKPENIFLVRDPEVQGGERAKILDFGIAKLSNDTGGVKTHTSAVIGTPMYMSPEQCRGAGQVDQRSDIYSLGCVLFTLVVGKPPFDGEGFGEIIAKHLLEPAPRASSRVSDVPRATDDLIARCLDKDPARRFTSGTELAAEIDVLLGRTTGPQIAVSASTPMVAVTPMTQTTLSGGTGASMVDAAPKRSQIGLVAGIGIVVVAGGVSAFVVSRRSSDREHTPPPVASAPVPPVERISSPPPPTPVPDDPAIATTHRIAALLGEFSTWSKTHAGALCPVAKDVAADASLDGWGNGLTLTCTDQPADQIVGVISAGPDGAMGTADDIASWTLGHDITAIVHGARWRVAAQAHTPTKSKPVAAHHTKPAAPTDDIPDNR